MGMDISVLGVDLGKNICSVVGLDASGAVVLRRRAKELCRKLGDGVNQAADLISATASIPSLNFIPLTTFGNWF